MAFAVVGHNEERTVARALRCAEVAMQDDDELWFVNSASLDRSRSQAEKAGARILDAPLGKGRAMGAFLAVCQAPYACFLDADIFGTDMNIARLLRQGIVANGCDMVIGQFDERHPSMLSNTVGIYEPLVRALFPEAVDCCGDKPLSGFRAVRTGAMPPSLPPDFGVEAYLNVWMAMRRRRTRVLGIGRYDGRFLYKPGMGHEIASALLDLAVAEKRLEPELRPRWDAWVSRVVQVIAEYRNEPGQREDFESRLLAASGRPLPPARHGLSG